MSLHDVVPFVVTRIQIPGSKLTFLETLYTYLYCEYIDYIDLNYVLDL